MSELGRLSFTLPAPAGLVRISMADLHGRLYEGDTVDLSPEDAAGFATKLLVLSALASKDQILTVEKITERLRWLLETASRSAALLDVQVIAEPELVPEPVLEPAPELIAEEPGPDDGAPEKCATCGVDLGSWPAAVEHGRIGCKTVNTGDVPCPDCGRKFATVGGLGVHRARAHREPHSQPVTSLVDRLYEQHPELENDDEDAWEPSKPQRAGEEPAHRLADLGQRGATWHALCTCGVIWEANDKAAAREALREHIEAA